MDIILRRSLPKLREKLLEAPQAVLLAVVMAESWQKIQKDLRRKMQIDVPGTGIAFIVPLISIGGKRALMFLTEQHGRRRAP